MIILAHELKEISVTTFISIPCTLPQMTFSYSSVLEWFCKEVFSFSLKNRGVVWQILPSRIAFCALRLAVIKLLYYFCRKLEKTDLRSLPDLWGTEVLVSLSYMHKSKGLFPLMTISPDQSCFFMVFQIAY